jgi:hypothetical protein
MCKFAARLSEDFPASGIYFGPGFIPLLTSGFIVWHAFCNYPLFNRLNV